MTWIKLQDNAPRHPKIVGLSDRAFRVWINSICYASEFLTDGVVPSVFMLGVKPAVRAELLAAGLWTLSADQSRLSIHEYLQHQTSRADVEKERARNKARRAGGTAGTPGGRTEENPRPENREQRTDTETEHREQLAPPERRAPAPLTGRRNLHAEFEHPRFDVPTWWHLEKVKGVAGGEARMVKFYQWLAGRVERTGEDTEPRKKWLESAWADWLESSRVHASSVPSPAETAKMIADRIAMAGR